MVTSVHPGKSTDRKLESYVRKIETTVSDPDARAAIYKDASERARVLAPKVTGPDGGRLTPPPAEGLHPKIVQAVDRVKGRASAAASHAEPETPAGMKPPGSGVSSADSDGGAPERPSAAEHLDSAGPATPAPARAVADAEDRPAAAR